MTFSNTILSGLPSFMHPDDEEERRKILFESQFQAAPPVEPVAKTNAWTDPVFLQAMVPVFTQLQGLKADLARYREKEAATDPIDLGTATPGATTGTASDAAMPGWFSAGARLAMNGPAARPAAPATQAQPASGIPAPNILFGPQIIPGTEGEIVPPAQPGFGGIPPASAPLRPQPAPAEGGATATPNPAAVVAAPIPRPRPDWSAQPAAPAPVPKPNPFARAPDLGETAPSPSAASVGNLPVPINAGDPPVRIQDLRPGARVAIRTRDLKPEVKAVLNYSAAAVGADLVVTSAGQYSVTSPEYKKYLNDLEGYQDDVDRIKAGIRVDNPRPKPKDVREPDSSSRHDDGFAGDVQLVVRDSSGTPRTLRWDNPGDLAIMTKFVEHAVEAGATGIGAEYRGMGFSSIHVGFGKPNTWGTDGKAIGPGPAWVRAGNNAGKAKREAFTARNGLKPWLDAVNAAP